MSVIDNLRANPIVVMQRNHFYIGHIDSDIDHKGSIVILEPHPEKYDFSGGMVGHTIYRLNVVNIRGLGYDFYFPFIPKKYGKVLVPDKMLAFRPICVTGGMNGCALEVRYFDGEGYRFYHDADGKNSNRIAQSDGGTLVCRIESDAYHNEVIAESCSKEGARCNTPLTIAVYFICVYDGSFWHVFASGVTTNSRTGNVSKVFWPIDKTVHPNEYKRYFGIFNSQKYLMKRDRPH